MLKILYVFWNLMLFVFLKSWNNNLVIKEIIIVSASSKILTLKQSMEIPILAD